MSRVGLPVLEQIRIASACHARWDEMTGDEKSRHCSLCDLRVYNLSAMTRDEAEALLASPVGQGGMCARLYKRPDGTVMTRDCPHGAARERSRERWTLRRIGVAFGLIGSAAAGGVLVDMDPDLRAPKIRGLEPFRSVIAWLAPAPPVSAPIPLMGKVCIPTAPIAPPAPAAASPSTGN